MNEGFPPPNRAIGWYRFVIWLMPSCVLTTTSIVSLRFGLGPDLPFWMAIILNVVIAIAAGIFDSQFGRYSGSKRAWAAVRFVVYQVMIAPVVAVVMVYALCSAQIL